MEQTVTKTSGTSEDMIQALEVGIESYAVKSSTHGVLKSIRNLCLVALSGLGLEETHLKFHSRLLGLVQNLPSYLSLLCNCGDSSWLPEVLFAYLWHFWNKINLLLMLLYQPRYSYILGSPYFSPSFTPYIVTITNKTRNLPSIHVDFRDRRYSLLFNGYDSCIQVGANFS